MATSDPITWKGEYPFLISGSGLHEDTLRVRSSAKKQEQLLELVLPTLCITYADAAFQDSVGGQQENYPTSRTYGMTHFDPPVELVGEQDIEKFTYIRGARRVVIGPEKTVIEFGAWNELVVPRLRIDQKRPAEANILVPETRIEIDEPLRISALQYADGRHVGGVRLEKRHPKWEPDPDKETYSLWIRVIDGHTLEPIPEARVTIWHCCSKASPGDGIPPPRLDAELFTDGDGCIHVPDRPSGHPEAYVVTIPGSRVVARCLRPLAGQRVRLHMRAWPLKPDKVRFAWPVGEKLDVLSSRGGIGVEKLLELNRFKGSARPRAGMHIDLPTYLAEYFPEPWDTLDQVGEMFGYGDAAGLAAANGLRSADEFAGATAIRLPDWHFYYAQAGDTLARFDSMFGLPAGSSIAVGRVFHPDPDLPFPGETVAVPSARFAEKLAGGDERT